MAKLLRIILVACLLVSLMVPAALAMVNQTGQAVRVAPDQVIDDDFFAAGESITIEGTVNGDAFVSGSKVLVTGVIRGNLYATGRKVEVRGRVQGTTIAAAEEVVVQGAIDRLLMASGATVRVEEGTVVGHNILAAGAQVLMAGETGRGLAVGAGTLWLEGKVGREVRAAVDRLEIASSAVATGQITHWGRSEAKIAPGARVGPITFHQTTASQSRPWYTRPLGVIAKFGGFLAAGLLLLFLFPNLRRRFPQYLEAQPWRSLLIGLLSLVALPIGIIVSMVTVIGLPLGLFTLIVLAPVIYFGQILIALAVGRLVQCRIKFLEAQNWPVTFVLGALTTTVVAEIPWLGGAWAFAAICMGLGGMYLLLVNGRGSVSHE